jgi:hypothetical protein
LKTLYILLAFCLFFALGCSYFGGENNTTFHALIIGINNYTDPSVPDLNYCVNDANDMHDTLIQNGWKDEEITLLLDGEATKNAILSAMDSMVKNADASDYILIFYSGHGTFIADSSGDETDGTDEAIVPVDYIYGNNSTLILDDEIGECFASCKTEKGAFIFDSCNSGGFINKSGAISTGGFIKRSPVAGEPQARYFNIMETKGPGANGDLDVINIPVLTASGENEDSFEFPSLQHGVFTYFILEAMHNRNADTNHDGYITIRELFDYAEIQTESFSLYQHPQLRFSRDLLDILITR